MKKILAIIILTAAFLTGCGTRSYTGPKAVFMGDSITQMWNEEQYGHPDYFASHGYLNKGISGETTTMMLKRFERDVCDTDPGCVVILAGVNDVAGNDGAPKTTEEILANIRAMAERADAAGIPVIICSPLPANHFFWRPEMHPEKDVARLYHALKEFAEEEHYPFADYFAALADADGCPLPQYTIDGVHASPEAYTVMEGIVTPIIEGI